METNGGVVKNPFIFQSNLLENVPSNELPLYYFRQPLERKTIENGSKILHRNYSQWKQFKILSLFEAALIYKSIALKGKEKSIPHLVRLSTEHGYPLFSSTEPNRWRHYDEAFALGFFFFQRIPSTIEIPQDASEILATLDKEEIPKLRACALIMHKKEYGAIPFMNTIRQFSFPVSSKNILYPVIMQLLQKC